MIRIMSAEEMAKIPVAVLPPDAVKAAPAGAPCWDGGTNRCEAFRPDPQPSGNLQVDPDIILPSPGMDVNVALYYNSNSWPTSPFGNGPFGLGRTISPSSAATLYNSSNSVIIQRGNGSIVSYTNTGGGFVPATPGVLNSLVLDNVNGLIKETTPDGITSAYPLDATGNPQTITWVQDAIGNIHTHNYSSGLLSSIEDGSGRRVTFAYSSGLLSSIQDWAGRITSFAYDTVSAAPFNLLTTVTGPTGCQTGYQYQNIGTVPQPNWALSGIIDPNGYGVSYTYSGTQVATKTLQGVGTTSYVYITSGMEIHDPLGNITTQLYSADNSKSYLGGIDPTGARTTITRNSNNQQTSFQNGLGYITTDVWDGSGNLVGNINALGQRTTLTRDAYNNITSIQTPDGAIVTNVWGYVGSSFDTTGEKRRLQARIDQSGYITSMTYTGRGLLATVQDPSGFVVSHNYDAYGNRISTQDALGYLTTLTRDLAGNVIAKMDPNGNVWSQTWDNQNRPLVSTDPLGNAVTNAYDSVGNRTIQISPLGFRTTWAYNIFDKPISQQDALGNFTTAVYDLLGRQIATIDPLGNINSTTLDGMGRPIARMNPLGFLTSYTFDAVGRQITTQNALGYISTNVYDAANRQIASIDALGNISTIIRDANGRQIASQNPLGYLISTVYDAIGQTIGRIDANNNRSTTVYDPRGLAIAQIDALNRYTTSVYDPKRQIVASVDALGYYSTSVYDPAGRGIASIDARGFYSTSIYDNANRNIASINALGYYSTALYDAGGRNIASIDALGRISTRVYDALNRVYASISPLGYITTVSRDAAGRTISTQNAIGSLYSLIYDNAGQQLASISPLGYRTTNTFDAVGQAIATQNALGYLATRVYDPIGRISATVNPLGYRTSNVYDVGSQNIATIDALGNRVSVYYAPNGWTTATQDARGYITTLVRDAAGQQTCVLDANGGRSTNLYDVRGNVYATQDPLGALTSFSFDPNGNTILRVDARNWPTSYTQDALNRTAQIVYIDGTRATNTWDAVGQQITMQDVSGITTSLWDTDGRKVGTQFPTGVIFTSTLDPVGNRLVQQDNFGVTTIIWDASSQLSGIIAPQSLYAGSVLPISVSYVRDGLGRETQRNIGMIVASVSTVYDPAGRVTAINTNAFYAPSFSNYYDAVGNRIGVVESNGNSVSYSYDPSYQLINEVRTGTNPFNISYTFDPLGNRLVQNSSGQITTRTFNAANEMLTATAPSGVITSRTYDAAGNLTLSNAGGVVTTFTWNGDNRLLSCAQPSLTESYTYRDDGLRASKTSAGSLRNYSWDEQNMAIATDGSFNQLERQTDAPGEWGSLVYQLQDGYFTAPLFDAQGTTRWQFSFQGTSFYVTQLNYDAFGNLVSIPPAQPEPLKFVGQYGYYTDATGFVYVRNRYYDPVNGIWITRDPIGFNGGDWNLYQIVSNSPTSLIDPAGLSAQTTSAIDSDTIYNPARSIFNQCDPGECKEVGLGFCNKSKVGKASSDRLIAAEVKAVFGTPGCLMSGTSGLNANKLLQLLTKVMQCIAVGESQADPACVGPGLGPRGHAKGLFQLDQYQFNTCGSGGKICDGPANVKAAMAALSSHWSYKGGSIDFALNELWAAYRETRKNVQFISCMGGEALAAAARQVLSSVQLSNKCPTVAGCEGLNATNVGRSIHLF